MKKWVCSVCGYVWEGETAPEKCPVCGVGADKFNEMKGDAKLAAEHEFGIYGSLTARAIPRLACIGRRPLTRRPSTPPSSPSCWAPTWSPP